MQIPEKIKEEIGRMKKIAMAKMLQNILPSVLASNDPGLTFVNMVNEAFSGDPTEGLPMPPETRESFKKLTELMGPVQKVSIQLQFINVASTAGLLKPDVELALYKAANKYLCDNLF